MDSARGWLQKLHRDKDKGKPGSSPPGSGMAEEGEAVAVSAASKQKADAAKQCIENMYKEQARSTQERKERSVPADHVHRSPADSGRCFLFWAGIRGLSWCPV